MTTMKTTTKTTKTSNLVDRIVKLINTFAKGNVKKSTETQY